VKTSNFYLLNLYLSQGAKMSTLPNEPSSLPSKEFLAHLATANPTPEALATLFNTTLKGLKNYLNDENHSEYLRFKRRLLSLKFEYIALDWVPAAIENLRRLTLSEKPEVARRSTMALIEFAALPKPDPKAPAREEPKPIRPEQVDGMILMLKGMKKEFKRRKLDPSKFPPPDPPPTIPTPHPSSYEI
jgi:hypothetical protein